jgi:DNA-binding NtrC family response regulator
MAHETLAGRLILVAEDEALISMEIEASFTGAGARVRVRRTVGGAMLVAEDADLVAAVVNHVLEDGETSPVCARLTERGIPFVLFSGYANVEGACRAGVRVYKPTTGPILLATVAGLFGPHLALVPKSEPVIHHCMI